MIRWLLLCVSLFVVGCGRSDMVETRNVPEQFIGAVKLDEMITVRLLVLKHCPDAIGNTDSNQAVAAANLAATKGLTIKDIGNYHIDKNGRANGVLVWGKQFADLEGLKRFISEQMKVDAQPDDTLVIYTIGHGGGGGELMRLGQREPFMKIMAEAAEENDQETFWWQLSCHAGAKLPAISTLNERQQELFSMTASSPGNELSYFCTQGALMQKFFGAMATKSSEIDPDQDGVITAGELKTFMVKSFGQKRGSLLFAKSDEEPIFGLLGGLANRIPIVDRNGPQIKYPKNYIPRPNK